VCCVSTLFTFVSFTSIFKHNGNAWPKNYKGFVVRPSKLKIKITHLFLITKAGVTAVHAVSTVWYNRNKTAMMMMPNIVTK
jgi:hypothetical protein